MANCPHCKLELKLNKVNKEKKGMGIFKQEIMYSCPHCECILGISRGKWTG